MLTSESRRPLSRLPDGLDGPASVAPSGTLQDAAARVYQTRIKPSPLLVNLPPVLAQAFVGLAAASRSKAPA